MLYYPFGGRAGSLALLMGRGRGEKTGQQRSKKKKNSYPLKVYILESRSRSASCKWIQVRRWSVQPSQC